MAIVALLALLVSGTLAVRSRAVAGYPVIAIAGLLFFYALLLASLGMHKYEPAFSTAAVLVLHFTSGISCASGLVLRRSGEA
jgi:CHASE2 domain-containing sensor protein